MPSHLYKTARAYVLNLGKRAKRIVLRREGIAEAVAGVSSDSRKLRNAVKDARQKAKGHGSHHRAARMLEKGRKAYNEKDLAAAEELFRSAILEDPMYAMGYYFLGATMYKSDRLREAVMYWTKAIEIAPGSDAAARSEKALRRADIKRDEVIAALEDRFD